MSHLSNNLRFWAWHGIRTSMTMLTRIWSLSSPILLKKVELNTYGRLTSVLFTIQAKMSSCVGRRVKNITLHVSLTQQLKLLAWLVHDRFEYILIWFEFNSSASFPFIFVSNNEFFSRYMINDWRQKMHTQPLLFF